MSDILESYGNIKIEKIKGKSMPSYTVDLPVLSPEERHVISNARSMITDYGQVMNELNKLRTHNEKEIFLRSYLTEKVKQKQVSPDRVEYVVSKIIDELFMGYGKLGVLMRDENLEEIMVNGLSNPVFIVHRKHGMCETNIKFESLKALDSIINWLSRNSDRDITPETPLLDAHMMDGSRANVAIAPAAPYGPSITIRRFKKVPYTILDLIELRSLTSELAAFLWVCVEGMGLSPMDILVAGGAGSGKTTLLNALAMFIPQTERIVTIEDTLELNFDFLPNWVPLEAFPTSLRGAKKLSMHDLMKNSLRMRPDRVIVGEMRGEEAETFFVAMDIGLEGSMGTIHANSARETSVRLMDEPMNVPSRMLPLLDLIVVCNKIYRRGEGTLRRITQVAEIAGLEKEVIQMGDIFTWEVSTDNIKRTNYPILLSERLAKRCGITKIRLNKEIMIRQRILEQMIKNGIREYRDVLELFQKYHQNPKSVLKDFIGSSMPELEE
ncbi:MAG: CpaF family protein [Candidatus Altiarchaeales archaeon]|nr:CpaF family protein [Candidatus Altiarchaeales archaeon]